MITVIMALTTKTTLHVFVRSDTLTTVKVMGVIRTATLFLTTWLLSQS